jgi:signal peptidase II
VAEAERIIGTPDTPEAAGAEPEPSGGNAGQPERPDSDDSSGADESTAQAAGQQPRGRRRIAVLFGVAAFAYVIDLVSKLIVVAKLEHHQPGTGCDSRRSATRAPPSASARPSP